MKKINLLLGGAERSLSRVVQASVLDVCYNQAAVETTIATRLGQFSRQGCAGSFDLLILIPECLLPDPNLGGNAVPLDHLLEAIRTLTSQALAPVIVLTANAQERQAYLDAGVDAVVTQFFDTAPLKSEVRRLLDLPDLSAQSDPDGWSLAALLWRGFQRLKKA